LYYHTSGSELSSLTSSSTPAPRRMVRKDILVSTLSSVVSSVLAKFENPISDAVDTQNAAVINYTKQKKKNTKLIRII
jgi:hypothetical protein